MLVSKPGPVKMNTDERAPLILASTSRYRAELLGRLRLPFVQAAPGVDETPLPGEAPEALAHRLAQLKAKALARQFPGRWVLGSDQVCSCAGQVLGKPGTRERAVEQLGLLSGQSASFITAVSLVRAEDAACHTAVDHTRVHFRSLTPAAIERYLDAESALDCAGSFKSEGLGICLCSRIESVDPTALVGLPLIAVCTLLQQAGITIP